MKNIGTELDPAALVNVHGGGFRIWGDPQRPPFEITNEQIKKATDAIVYVAKKVWNALTSWF